MDVHLLVLNYNGRRLLPECLPSVVCAAEASRHPCQVRVIDNDSDDGSLDWLDAHFPQVPILRRPNRGLCSFNDVVAELPGSVAVLLNNDVRLDRGAVDPLVAPLLPDQPEYDPKCFLTAPLCRQFDGHTYEGCKTSVRWRWGLVQATALYPGHEATVDRPGLTASSGAVLAVDCRKFAELGGFDPLYLPGRLEDLDFAFRGYLSGYHGRYVPAAVAYHRGMGTFGPAFGAAGCERLALRNTLLFQWKNLRHPQHVWRQLLALPVRLAADLCRAPWTRPERRWVFAAALGGALKRLGQVRASPYQPPAAPARERDFFREFHPKHLVGNTVP